MCPGVGEVGVWCCDGCDGFAGCCEDRRYRGGLGVLRECGLPAMR